MNGVVGYWATPGRFTELGDAGVAVAGVAEAIEVVQGLLVYDVVAADFYGAELTEQQAGAINERSTAALLALALEVDGRALTEAREPAARVGARCHAFSRVTVALLRAVGVPARARCGFATYFLPGYHEDHWVAEYWDAERNSWHMADAQLDATWRELIGFAGSALDVDDTQFVTAGHAWQAWRRGELDAARCGLSAIGEHGAHWMAHNLRLDLASLNKVEMLPWDVWGAGWEPGEEPAPHVVDLFDQVAELTVAPDLQLTELRHRYDSDHRLRMDGEVFNVDRGCIETV